MKGCAVSTRFTLELSEAVVQRAQEIADRTGRSVDLVLKEWLEWGAMQGEEGVEHHIYAPFFDESGALAQSLHEMVEAGSDRAEDQKS